MCERVALPGGGYAIVCGGHRRSTKKCAHPTCRSFVTVECDHKDEHGKTCDRGTCRAHAKPIGKDIDWCWLCAQAEAKRGNAPRLTL